MMRAHIREEEAYLVPLTVDLLSEKEDLLEDLEKGFDDIGYVTGAKIE